MAKEKLILCFFFLFTTGVRAEIKTCDTQKAYEKDITHLAIDKLNRSDNGSSENLRVLTAPDGKPILEIFVPSGSYDPLSMQRLGLRRGGVNERLFLRRQTSCLYMSYKLKFGESFQFVKGGKLFGIAGGEGNTGGKAPNGTDGFSARLMWGPGGRGALYAYLPGIHHWGKALSSTEWTYPVGEWFQVDIFVRLNSQNNKDGEVKVWVNKKLVDAHDGLYFREGNSFKIDSVLLSIFFGGNNSEFAAIKDSLLYISDLRVSNFHEI